MTYSVIDVAKYIINKSIEIGNPVSNLKLQKLLYYVQAASLVTNGVPLFEEPLVAWQFGPVSEAAYNMFKKYYNKNILEVQNMDKTINFDDENIIYGVVYAKRKDHAFDLVRTTHNEAPWSDAKLNSEIGVDDIKKYFKHDKNEERIWKSSKSIK